MATAILKVYAIGTHGVNVDKDPIELENDELVFGKNANSMVIDGKSSVGKRPGLGIFTTSDTAGVILGGIDVPLLNLSSNSNGFLRLFIGRGPTT